MARENFEALYSVLEMIENSTDDPVSVTVEGLSYSFSGKDLRSQAAKVKEILDAYKEPELPFKGITQEQIDREHKRLQKKYGFVVWSNELAGTDEDCADRVENDPDYFLGMSEDEVRQISYEAYAEDRDILKEEFDHAMKGPVLIFGTLGRWDGPKPVFKVIKSLKEIFGMFTGDQFTLYIKDGQLKAENCHHDGTDCFTVHKFKEGVDPEAFCLIDQVGADTESLVPELEKHFGWTLRKEKETAHVNS